MNDQTLQAWIMTATAGLPPSAVEKFSAEILDHAAESRKGHIEGGIPPDEADRATLAELGDAHAVGRTLREAHFSRRAYAHGETALLLMFAAFAVSVLIGAAPSWINGSRVLWLEVAYLAISLAIEVLFLFGIHAGITLLREQYDMRPPRWGWPLFAALGMIAGVALMANQAISRSLIESASSGLAPGLPKDDIWMQASMILSAINQLGMIGAGALLAAFCFGQWWPRRWSMGLTPGVLLAMGGIGGAAMAATNVMWLAVSGDLSLAPLANQLSPFVTMPYLVLYISMQVTLASLLGRMRHPGAVLAR